MNGRPNSRNKATFSNFFGVVWTGLKNIIEPPSTATLYFLQQPLVLVSIDSPDIFTLNLNGPYKGHLSATATATKARPSRPK